MSQSKLNQRSLNIFPLKDFEAYKSFVKLSASHWGPFEIKYIDDKKDYEKLKEPDSTGKNAAKLRLLNLIFAFFGPADMIVAQNLAFNFLKESTTPEEILFLGSQLNNELVHSVSYGLYIHTMVDSDSELETIFNMINEIPEVKAKADLMNKYMYGDYPIHEKYVAFVCAELILFSVLFNIIYFFRSYGMLNTLILLNDFINRDEQSHGIFGSTRYKKYKPDNCTDRTLQIVLEFVEVETAFIKFMLPEPIDDLNSESMIGYLHYLTDDVLRLLNEPAYFNSGSVPEWLKDISLQTKNNFFEVSTNNYAHFSVSDALDIDKLTGKKKTVDSIANFDSVDF
jgi:ribonucleotide reductase beta subunit family protein with ferritin-like domain